jgi:hypothetical protein
MTKNVSYHIYKMSFFFGFGGFGEAAAQQRPHTLGTPVFGLHETREFLEYLTITISGNTLLTETLLTLEAAWRSNKHVDKRLLVHEGASNTSGFPAGSITPRMLRTHLFVYRRRYGIFAIE